MTTVGSAALGLFWVIFSVMMTSITNSLTDGGRDEHMTED
eukprot:COSAG06_NODE_7947_length_2325_cov_18.452830_3_plen_40_part_00